jgi:hypothetical protein
MEPFNQLNQLPDAREYLHDRCGLGTCVSGDDFHALCDPRFAVRSAFCEHCDEFDSLSAFRWTDSNEGLIAYRVRLAGMVPLWARLAGAKWLFGVWIILAVLCGFGLSQLIANFKIAYGIPAVVFFIIAMACDAAGKFSTQSIKFHQVP